MAVATQSAGIISAEIRSASKVFNDPIHGSIELPAICVAIIDTPEFQRLRHIKQLGLTCLVYPTAVHTRFDHSIGVCHLADQLVQALRKRHEPYDSQPIEITEEERLCVMIAGLCRDLGFGPFSHLFDQRFMKKKRKDYMIWAMSEKIFAEICKRPEVKGLLTCYNLNQEIKFIQELINPPPHLWEKDGTRRKYKTPWCCKGRGEDKSFLYLIVKNTLNGIDVAKWDYCARDCHFLGIKNSFDHQRLLQFSRVLRCDGRYEICFKDKEAFHLYNLYRMRHVLHTHAYQHHAKNAVEIMFSEALEEVEKALDENPNDPYLTMLFGEGNLSCKVDDVHEFLSLTDDIYRKILLCPISACGGEAGPLSALCKARAIVEKIETRKLYKLVIDEPYRNNVTEEELLADLDLPRDKAIVEIVRFDYGLNREKPLKNVHFFNKSDPNRSFFLRKEDEPPVLPENLPEQKVRVYCKISDCRDEIMECLNPWWDKLFGTEILKRRWPFGIGSPTTPVSPAPGTAYGSILDPREPNIAKRNLNMAWEDQPSTSQESMELGTRRSERIAGKKMKIEDQRGPVAAESTERSSQQQNILQRCFEVVVDEARNVWKDIARCLQLRPVDIDSIDSELRGNCKECTWAILNQWATREGKKATIGRLMDALECAERTDVKDIIVSEIAGLEGSEPHRR